jgi:purine nucleosidase
MERFIIDTDPGVDDAHAIMMAIAHPQVTVEALTVVAGNVGLDNTVANALKILDVMEADIPVYAGCETAYLFRAEDAAYVHGQDGLGDSGLPISKRPVSDEHASSALVRMANAEPGELSLIAIGPLTNLAVALKLDPELPSKFKRLLIMGGAVHSRGNTENVSTEFNIYADPDAAYVVFDHWPEVTVVSWEATMDHGIPEEVVKRWLALDTPRARFFQKVTSHVLKFIREVMGRTMMFGADGLAMAVACEPDIVRRAEKHHLTVETAGRYTRGQTTVDWGDRSGQTANAEVVMEVDLERFHALMEMALE